MLQTKIIFDFENLTHLLAPQAWLLSLGQNLSRSTKTFLLITLLSACNQTEPLPVQNNQVSLGKIELGTTTPYGRKAEFSYPGFSGTFDVASDSIVMTDFSRMEPFELDSIENRKLHVRFYYPTDHSVNKTLNQKRLPIISPEAWDYLVGPHSIDGKMLRFDNYRTAQWDISIGSEVSNSQTDYPVLVFSHGYGLSAESYSALSAELASQGFIVVSINHTYGANPTNLGNQQLIWAKPLPSDSMGVYLPIWSDDQIFVIDQLALINSDTDSLFYNKLNLSNLGIFGHSYGGAASYLTASRDPRIKAIIDIDGTIFDDDNIYIDQPFAYILSKDHQPKFDYTHIENDSYEIRLNQFEHLSFTDVILWWQWDHDNREFGLGTIDSHRAVELTTELVSDFFGKYLSSKPAQWFEDDDISTLEISLIKPSSLSGNRNESINAAR